MRNFNTLLPQSILKLSTAGACLVLAACSNSAESTETTLATPPASAQEAPMDSATFMFDDLGGGYEEIFVYEGAGSEFSGLDIGFYLSGRTAVADCITTGRTITSDTAVGETARESDQWLHIEDSESDRYPGGQFATLVYTNMADLVASSLPPC